MEYMIPDKNNTQELVIAECNENLEKWLDKYAPKFDFVTIYNKCDKVLKYKSPNIKVINTPNIGSCDYAYLSYIIDRYDSLPDFIEFTKGWKEPTQKYHSCNLCTDKQEVLYDELMNFSLKTPYSFANPDNGIIGNKSKWHLTKYKNMREWIKDKEFLNQDMYESNMCNIVYGGHFGASKEQILKTPKKIWELLRSEQKYTREEVDHFIERTWRPLLCKIPSIKIAFVSGYVGPENESYATNRVPNLIKGDNIDCYFITNLQLVAENAKEKGWIVKIIPTPKDQSYNGCNLACKLPKVFPQKFANHKKYDFIIWFDNKFDPKINEVIPVLNNWDQNKCVAMHRHPFLSDKNGNGGADKELKESLKAERYRLQRELYEKYINEEVDKGFSINGEKHYTCCFIIYNNKHPNTLKIQNTWMNHINRCGIQDQISMYFVAQRFKKEIYEFVGGGRCGG
tara:strand:- start:333 stop:1694 length:1362 start_codon:yes stop_codon:yes gene_type:complete